MLQPKASAPLISVCIPVYNGERYIRECVASILAQGERRFELLIIDNCSTDRTLSICDEFTDARVRILKNSRNVGSIANFNNCIRNASGELIMLLPADDLLEEACLERLSRALMENPSVGIAFGSSIQINSLGEKLGVRLVSQRTGMVDRENAIRMIAEKFNPIQHPMVRSKVFSQIGTFNKRLGCFSDIHLWSKALFLGWDAYVICEPLTAMRRYEKQGQTLFRQNTKDNLAILSAHYGQTLASSFYRTNHYNLLFFRFVRLFNRNLEKMLCLPNDIRRAMINNLVRSHFSNIWSSVLHFNFLSLSLELRLARRLTKSFGPTRIGRAYVDVLVLILRRGISVVARVCARPRAQQ